MNVIVNNMVSVLPVSSYRTVLFLTLLLSAPVLEARDYYRYRNADGAMVISDVLTPEALDAGYAVTDAMGRVKDRVAPRPTAAELAERKRQREEEKRRKLEAQRQAEYDEQLLRRYSRPEELEAARERALEQIQVRIDILVSNRQTVIAAIEKSQEEAADAVRNKGEAPQDLLTNIELMRAELMETQRQLRFRQAELKARSDEFDRDRARLEHLRSEALIVESGLAETVPDVPEAEPEADSNEPANVRLNEEAETTAEETPWEKAVW